MRLLMIGLLGLILGLGLGSFLIGPRLLGSAAGIGVATGLGAGICTTVRAAQDEGFLTAEQVDRVLNRALQNMRDTSLSTQQIAGSAAECDRLLADLKSADSQ